MAVNAIDFSDLTKKPKIDSKTGLWKEPQPQQPQQNTQMGVKKSDGTGATNYGLSCKFNGSR